MSEEQLEILDDIANKPWRAIRYLAEVFEMYPKDEYRVKCAVEYRKLEAFYSNGGRNIINNFLKDPATKSEPSLNSPLIDKLVKDVAAIDTSRDMRSEPNTDLSTYAITAWVPTDGDINGKQVTQRVIPLNIAESVLALKVAEARTNTLQSVLDWYLSAKVEPYGGAVIDHITAELKADTE